MSSSSSLVDPQTIIAADASVIINLNGCRRARDIITALGGQWVVTDITLSELELGTRNGHDDAKQLRGLVDNGVVTLKMLDEQTLEVYAELIGIGETLDDGEASTIAYALRNNALAVVDERRARRICSMRFPNLRMASSVDLMLDSRVKERLGDQGQAEAVFFALQDAKMCIPRESFIAVRALIGPERTAQCASLSRLERFFPLPPDVSSPAIPDPPRAPSFRMLNRGTKHRQT